MTIENLYISQILHIFILTVYKNALTMFFFFFPHLDSHLMQIIKLQHSKACIQFFIINYLNSHLIIF